MNRTLRQIGLLLAVACTGAASIGWLALPPLRPATAPPPAAAPFLPAQTGPMGWAGEDAAAEARTKLAGQLPTLEIAGAEAQDTSNRLVCLWHSAKRMEILGPDGRTIVKRRGQHLANIPQEIGDCVSWGYRNACNYSLASAIAYGEGELPYHQAFAPYIYGISRVQIGGGKIRGDGSTGAWAAAGVQTGVLSEDEEGLPGYSGSLARTWGAKPGPPASWQSVAGRYKAQARLVTTWDAATQALSNGWAVAVCSNAGFTEIVEANGRIEGRWRGSWAHCMCFVGYDSRPGREALYCLNSWGPTAHARATRYQELDGAPPGGFWVLKADAEKMLRAGDSYAISFNGFRPHTAEESNGLHDQRPPAGDQRTKAGPKQGASGLRQPAPFWRWPYGRLGFSASRREAGLADSRRFDDMGRQAGRAATEHQLAA